MTALDGFPLLGGKKYFPRLRAVELADDAVFGHVVDEPGGATVADAQCPLQQAGAAATLADDDVDRLIVQIVAIAAGTRSATPGCG